MILDKRWACHAAGFSRRREPVSETTLAVRADDNSEGPHDVEANVRQTLDFSEHQSGEDADFALGFVRGTALDDRIVELEREVPEDALSRDTGRRRPC